MCVIVAELVLHNLHERAQIARTQSQTGLIRGWNERRGTRWRRKQEQQGKEGEKARDVHCINCLNWLECVYIHSK